MSGRGASAAWLTELGQSKNAPAHLLELAFDAGDGGSLYLTDSYRPWTWGGHTYTAAGHLLGFSNLTESAELRVTDVTIELNAVDQTIISAALSKKYLGRKLLLYKLLVNQTTEALIVDPVLIHSGRMDKMSMPAGEEKIQVVSRDEFADFERLNGRHTNAAEQRALFPADGFFDLNAELAGSQTTLLWGAVRP